MRDSQVLLSRERVQSVGRVVGCALLTAICARFALRLPFTPVPVTWQVAAVLFSGLILGTRGAFLSQALYLLSGLAGAPVFAFGMGGAAYLFNPYGTGGYLLSYPLAAWMVAWVLQRARQEDLLAPIKACGAGLAVIYGLGCVWLGVWLHLSPLHALIQGAGWFLFWDMTKALLSLLVAKGLGGASGGQRDLKDRHWEQDRNGKDG